MDTIVALSSGRPPAAIGVIRVSGVAALAAVERIAGKLPAPRRVSLRTLRDGEGAVLDRALVLVFPGPASATGEDLVELHCHGGRATVAAVIGALLAEPGVRAAAPGEFTRRALANGVLDLAQAEGLADLLEAETEGARLAALAASEGRLSGVVRQWLDRLAGLSALVEAVLDYGDDLGDEAEQDLLVQARAGALALRGEIAETLAAPPVERWRDGVRVVLGGPPNSGKSTLMNLLVEREAAIVSPVPGTTRDRVDAPVTRQGIPYLLTDTAGLHDAADEVERIGIARATAAIEAADLLIWLGDEPPPRPGLWLHARADVPGRAQLPAGCDLAIRRDDLATITALWEMIHDRVGAMMPTPDNLPLKAAQREACKAASASLVLEDDPLIAGEQLRMARQALGRILGIDATEAMLDALFGRFCLGK